ncbi:MAG: hypothetical protein RSD49_01610 [Hafnia sp.]
MLNRAIERAYRIAQERNYNIVYWALDLHGTCIHSNYQQNTYNWINEDCLPALRSIAAHEETRIILWSSLHPDEIPNVVKFFEENGIKVFAVNENHSEGNTTTGNFDKKFYMSVIVDDKAGFDPEDWQSVAHCVNQSRTEYGFVA